jgi:large subunit ribosomal protein L15
MSKRENLNYSSLLSEKPRKKVERKGPAFTVELPDGGRKKGKRVGRGRSSGIGKTSGRGQKGQKSRTGYSRTAGFEGGQMPIHRRLPKRGFSNSIFTTEYQVVNLWRIEKAGLSGEITPVEMLAAGLIRDAEKPVKILGHGEVKSGIKITADAFSASAKELIGKAGGSCTVREAVKTKAAAE